MIHLLHHFVETNELASLSTALDFFIVTVLKKQQQKTITTTNNKQMPSWYCLGAGH
jgi:hypothetical protein